MPVAKLKASNATDVVKSEEGNDSLDTFIRQAIGKEPFLSFSRAGDSPVQWIQLLHALDQQDLPGWPLLTPLKVQMQKCDKCAREFCSPINYRRHIRVHHRLKKLDKDSIKNRELLGAFWDKLCVDEAKDIVSFKSVALEDVPGSSVVKALTTLIRKPGFCALPQVCLRAGSVLLDIIQARPSRFPISSQELFTILDDASEKTFLCGAAVSIQKYVFDGEAGKIGLETKNLVACTSFLLEQRLVKAWLADKDAEALRCQKMLVEEEEAAQRRQAELLERKKQKKLRQKELKSKDQRDGEKEDVKDSVNISDASEAQLLAETSCPLAAFDFDTLERDMVPAENSSTLELVKGLNTKEDVNHESQTGFASCAYTDPSGGPAAERRMVQGGGRRHMVVARWQVPPKSQRGMPHGFHANLSSHASKLGASQKHGLNKDLRPLQLVNGNKVWSRKNKLENDGGSIKPRTQDETVNQPDQGKNCEVLIGSISVALGNCCPQEHNNLAEGRNGCLAEPEVPKRNIHEKPSKNDALHHYGTNRAAVKLWRPVSRHGNKVSIPNGGRELEANEGAGRSRDANETLSGESCKRLCATENNDNRSEHTASLLQQAVLPGSMPFNSHDAKAFLSLRWKEAIAAEHVKLVLSPEAEPLGNAEDQNDYKAAVLPSSDFHKCTVVGKQRTGRLIQWPLSLQMEELSPSSDQSLKKVLR